ncbi:MAG: hemerythrin domain-containing protein [Rhodomicrobium sp.]
MTFPHDEHPSNGFAGSCEGSLCENSGLPDSTSDLIAFILDRYHAVHRKELPGLIVLARKVESVHAGHPDVPVGLADFLAAMADSLEDHMQKEEQILFPLFASGGHPMIAHPIAMMRAEHKDHTENLAALAGLAGAFTLPDGACDSWRALYAGLIKLSDDLAAHIRAENESLFPRFSA